MVESSLCRLSAKGGRLLRVRRGLYWKGVASRFGTGRPAVDDIVRVVAGGRGLGPAGWSAAHALGLSTQVPAAPTYAVVGPSPTGIPGASFRSRRNMGRLRLAYFEIALLEVLRDVPKFVEADDATLLARIAGLRDSGLIRPERVLRAAAGESSPVLRRRVAALVADLASRPRVAALRRA